MLPWLAPPAIENPEDSTNRLPLVHCHIPWSLAHTANAPPRNRRAEKCFADCLPQDAWTHNAAHYWYTESVLREDMSSTERVEMSWHVAASWAWSAASSFVEHS